MDLHTLRGTNCYLIGAGPKRILVDTGEGVPGFVEHLLGVMRQIGCTGLEAILLTHWHEDHTGGVLDVTYTLGDPNIRVYKRVNKRPEKFAYENIKDGQLFRTQSATLEAVYTPGHTTDHVSFILREERALLTGDMILGYGTALFDDYDSYMTSLQRIFSMNEEEAFSRLYPGHGPVVETARDKIMFYISHRQQRENQVLKVVKEAGGKPLSALQITWRVYGRLPTSLMVSGLHHVEQNLRRLKRLKKVEEGWFALSFHAH